jgi:hypothetical protein
VGCAGEGVVLRYEENVSYCHNQGVLLSERVLMKVKNAKKNDYIDQDKQTSSITCGSIDIATL